MKHIILFSVLILSLQTSQAAEEALDLETEKPAESQNTHVSRSSNFSLMGRVDLTAEISPYKPVADERQTSLKNNHFLIFLKVKASPKTNFMGEFVRQSFYFVDTQILNSSNIQFGKIIVPFGDTRRFHHLYGGIQGYGANGVMFPNVWAEPGLNLNWHLSPVEVDTYAVNSISADTAASDPDLQTSSIQRQAFGARVSLPVSKKVTGIISVYGGEHWPGRAIYLSGADLYSDYGALGFLSAFRLSMGIANASILNAPVSGTFEKRGDYLELATNAMRFGELRMRYGTYLNNHRKQTRQDVHNFNLGYSFDLDVIRVLTEYQWNFEAVDEVSNDVARVMTSVDF